MLIFFLGLFGLLISIAWGYFGEFHDLEGLAPILIGFVSFLGMLLGLSIQKRSWTVMGIKISSRQIALLLVFLIPGVYALMHDSGPSFYATAPLFPPVTPLVVATIIWVGYVYSQNRK